MELEAQDLLAVSLVKLPSTVIVEMEMQVRVCTVV